MIVLSLRCCCFVSKKKPRKFLVIQERRLMIKPKWNFLNKFIKSILSRLNQIHLVFSTPRPCPKQKDSTKTPTFFTYEKIIKMCGRGKRIMHFIDNQMMIYTRITPRAWQKVCKTEILCWGKTCLIWSSRCVAFLIFLQKTTYACFIIMLFRTLYTYTFMLFF